MEQKVTTPVVKGVLISLGLIVLGLALYFTGQSMNQALGSIQYVILLGGIIWGCINYANQMNNNVTFGNVFAHGFKITAVVTVIMIIYTVIAFKFIFPEMQDMAMEKARESMAKNKNITDDQIEAGINMTKKFFMVFVVGGILFFFMIIGLISSLIGAAASKKNPQSPFQQPG